MKISSGSVLIARPMPHESSSLPTRMLGFAPAMGVHDGMWLEISQAKGDLRLMQGEQALFSAQIEGSSELKPGTYHLLHKQTKPAWYAPDEYFVARNLPVPARSGTNRFLKGAFGDFVLVFDSDVTLHNATIWAQDVKGVRLSDNDLARIFYSLDLDAPIEVR